MSNSWRASLKSSKSRRSSSWLCEVDVEVGNNFVAEIEKGITWGGAFWELRKKLTAAKTEKLILTAWKHLDLTNADLNKAEFFINAILDANQKLGLGADPTIIREAFERRNLL
jgi:hypothetical protein